MINNNTPYLRNKIPTLLVFSAAAIALLLLTSTSLPLSTFLVQPVQAQTNVTFKTPEPANGNLPENIPATLTFDAQGTASDLQHAKITNGTIQVYVPDPNGDGSGPAQTFTGSITSGTYAPSNGGPIIDFYATIQNVVNYVLSYCSTSDANGIWMSQGGPGGDAAGTFQGAVECALSQSGGEATALPSSSLTVSPQGTDRGGSSSSSNSKDSDSDGISDSSDKCPHNSHHRCYKDVGDTGTTTSTTHDQQQPSTSSSSGNQTR